MPQKLHGIFHVDTLLRTDYSKFLVVTWAYYMKATKPIRSAKCHSAVAPIMSCNMLLNVLEVAPELQSGTGMAKISEEVNSVSVTGIL